MQLEALHCCQALRLQHVLAVFELTDLDCWLARAVWQDLHSLEVSKRFRALA